MPQSAKRVVLVSRPVGEPKASDFRTEDYTAPTPGPGQVLLRTIWLSLDPYMRGRMSDGPSYAAPVPIGGVMEGGTVSEVIASDNPGFARGDIVLSRAGWQTHAISDGKGLAKIDPKIAPISTAVGVLGMPGMTAYTGLLDIGKPQAGETVVVAAASGAVGSAVGQIARIKGCRTIGIAGGLEKCRHVVTDLGFDDCIDYKAGPIGPALAKATPRGVDIYFDNVGGDILDAVLPRLNMDARVPVCGQISQYNRSERPESRQGLRNVGVFLDKCVMLQGFRIGSHLARRDKALDELMQWFRAGRLKFHETVGEGLEEAPAALVNMLSGGNIGKQVVRLAVAA